MSVFDALIGQEHAVAEMKRAATDARNITLGISDSNSANSMTHAWLITGPPGSGRSTISLAFAAALVCPAGGCGECADCRNAMAGTHVDIEHIVPEGVIYTIDDTKSLIERASLAPSRSHWHVIVIEDVDRFRNDAASVLLKSLEEPPPGTVWLLCAPTSDDVFETIRSRCRQVVLVSPTLDAIAKQLNQRYGIDPNMATFAARAAQGHIGRARALASDELVRERRNEILDMPSRVNSVVACFEMANKIVANANADTDSIVNPLDEEDEENIRTAFGDGVEGFKGVERQIKSAVKALEKRAKDRRRRVLSDQYDRVLLDLTGFYRDVLLVQSGSDLPLINEELRAKIEKLAASSTSAETLKRIDVIRETRDNLLANVNPVSAFEAMLVTLRNPQLLASGS
jgi:DNA polymerase-3 subunit delta'